MSDNSLIYRDIFSIDGSLRDIYVQGTSEHDWQMVLDFLRASSYPLEFRVGQGQQLLPAQVGDIFVMEMKGGVTLCIDQAHLALNCHFFTREEIEFDLDPRDFQTEEQLLRLLAFLHAIGRLLNKVVILTPENNATYPLYLFDPESNEDFWFLEEIATSMAEVDHQGGIL